MDEETQDLQEGSAEDAASDYLDTEDTEDESLEEGQADAADDTLAQGAEAQAVEEEEEIAPSRAVPPAAAASTRLERLRQALDPELFADLTGFVQETIAHATQTAAYTNVQTAQAAQMMPELFKIHGAKIQGNIAAYSPDVKTSPKAVAIGVVQAMLEEINGVEDIPSVLARYSKLAGNAPAGRKSVKTEAPPVSQRPPSSGSVAASRPVANLSSSDRQINTLMKNYGISKSEAREMLNDERVR